MFLINKKSVDFSKSLLTKANQQRLKDIESLCKIASNANKCLFLHIQVKSKALVKCEHSKLTFEELYKLLYSANSKSTSNQEQKQIIKNKIDKLVVEYYSNNKNIGLVLLDKGTTDKKDIFSFELAEGTKKIESYLEL